VNDRVIVWEVHGKALPFEEFLQMLPIVHLLIQLEAVVILIHLDILRVVPIVIGLLMRGKSGIPGQDLCIEPAIGEVSLGVGYFIGEVQALEPNVQFSRECHHL